MIGNGNQLVSAFTYSKSGFVTTSYASDSVVQGRAFSTRSVFTLANLAVKNIIIDPSAHALNGFDVFGDPIKMSTTAGVVNVVLSHDFDYTALGDSRLYIFNRKGLKANGNDTKFYDTPTGVADVENNLEYTLGGKATNQSSGGGTVAGQQIFTLLNTEKYLLQFTNNSGEDDCIITLALDFYE